MTLQEWRKENPRKSVNEYYQQYGTPQNDVSSNNYNYSNIVQSTPSVIYVEREKPTYNYHWIAMVGAMIGLIAFYIPFMKIDLSKWATNDLERVIDAFIPEKLKKTDAFSLNDLNHFFKSTQYLKISNNEGLQVFQKIIVAAQILLGFIIIFAIMNKHFARKIANIIFICLGIYGGLTLNSLGSTEMQIGCYLIILCCLILTTDIFIPSPIGK